MAVPSGLTLTGSVLHGTINAAAFPPSGTFTTEITATDSSLDHKSVTSTFTWVLSDPATTMVDLPPESNLSSPISITLSGTSDATPPPTVNVVSIKDANGTSVSQPLLGSQGGAFSFVAGGNSIQFDPGYDPNDDFGMDVLGIGQTPRTTSVTYVLNDGGASLTESLRVAVSAYDNPPTAVPQNQTPDQVSTVGQKTITTNAAGTAQTSLNVSGAFDDSDVDFANEPNSPNPNYDKLTYSLSYVGLDAASVGGTLGLTINSSTGVITATGGTVAGDAGVYDVTITATDKGTKTATESFQWVILPSSETDSTPQDVPKSGNLLTDFDEDKFSGIGVTVAGFLQADGTVASTYTDAQGGIYALDPAANGDGDYTYTPGSNYDYLFVKNSPFASTTSSVTFVVGYESGDLDLNKSLTNTLSPATAQATLTFTITGLDDGPKAVPNPQDIVSHGDDLVSHRGDAINLPTADLFSDVDKGEAFKYSLTITNQNGVTQQSSGLSIDTASGIITSLAGGVALADGTYTVNITVTDNAGLLRSRSQRCRQASFDIVHDGHPGSRKRHRPAVGNVLHTARGRPPSGSRRRRPEGEDRRQAGVRQRSLQFAGCMSSSIIRAGPRCLR